MFRYETHLHTAEGSGCASASGAEQARRYKALGYDGIIVTDHFFNGNCAVTNFDSWEDRVNKFCKGYENAKEEGDKIGLKVFFGLEYSYFGADLLTYGIDKDFLLANDNISDISFYQFADRVHKAGGVLVHAHPFREADWYIHEIKLLPKWIDGVEVYNSGNGKEVYISVQSGMPNSSALNRQAVRTITTCGWRTAVSAALQLTSLSIP